MILDEGLGIDAVLLLKVGLVFDVGVLLDEGLV